MADTLLGRPAAVRAGRAVAALAGAEIAGKLSTVVVTVGVARALGVADFGRFSVALAVGLMLAVLPAWGLDTVVTQRASADRRQLPALLARLLTTRAVLGGAVLAGYLALALCWPGPLGAAGPTGAGAGRWAGLLAGGAVVAACLADTVTEAYRSAAAAAGRQTAIALAHLVQRLATAAVTLAVLALWPRLTVVCVAFLLGTLTGPVAAAVLCRARGLRPDWSAVSLRPVLRMVRDSWAIGLVAVLSMALFRLDTALLGALAGAAAAGAYAAAYRLLDTVVFVCWALIRVLFPVMAGDPTPRRLRQAGEYGLTALAAAFLPYLVVLLLRGPALLGLLFGGGYASSAGATLVWLAPAPLAFGAAYLAGHLLVAPGPTARAVTGLTIALALNIALELVLIPRYGGAGAAAATTISYAAEAVALLLLARGRAELPRPGRALLPAAVGSLAAAVPLASPLTLLPALLLAVVAYLVVWAGTARLTDPAQLRYVLATLHTTPEPPR